jgi:hypothetical protein
MSQENVEIVRAPYKAATAMPRAMLAEAVEMTERGLRKVLNGLRRG